MSYQIENCSIHNLDKLYINLEKNTQNYMKIECIQCIQKESISIEEILMKFKQLSAVQSKISQQQDIYPLLKTIVQQSNFVLKSFQQLHQTISEYRDQWLKIYQQHQVIQKFSKSNFYNQEDLSQIAQITLNSNDINVPNFVQDQFENFQKLTSKLQKIEQILNSNPIFFKENPQISINNENEQKIQQIQKDYSAQQIDFQELSQFQTNIIVYAIAFSFDNQKIVIGGGNQNQGENKNLMVLGLSGDNKLKSETILLGHSKRVTAISYSKNDHFFVSGSLDSTLRLWKFDIKNKDWECIKQLNKHTSTVLGVVISNRDQQIISCGHDSKIIIWKYINNDWQDSQLFSDHIAAVNSISFSEDNYLLASGSEDSKVYIWRNENQLFHKIDQIDVPCQSYIYSVQFIKQNSLIVGTYDGNISIWKNNQNQNRYEICFENNLKFGYIKKIVYNYNSQLLITKCEHRTVIWRIINNEKIEKIKDYEGEYLGIGLSQGPSIIAMFNCQKKELQLLQ
ncbi:unnamed protein product [Paramecium sonneborni]|uniref:WD40-repeat-containing domain n=1 Tax=Paramecium sonneborni TaxID=65129 RepID=A0A8S1PU15_9CILI|nr:unnamed protein product [Paramecium sonneborni]